MNKIAKRRRGPGRPEAKIDIREVRKLAGRGLTTVQIAGCLGISHETFHVHQAKYPEFSEAVNQGRAVGISLVANALFEKATSGDVPAAIFFLKARANWKDKLELAGDPENPIQHVISARPLTAEEWEKQYGENEEKLIEGD